MKGAWSTMSWSSVLLCFALWHGFGKLEAMSGKSMASPAVPAMRRTGRIHSGNPRVGWFARSMGCNCIWAGRAASSELHPWDLTASVRGGLMDVLIYQFGFFEAAL